MALTTESNRTALAEQSIDRRTLGLTALSGLLIFVVSLGTWSDGSTPEVGKATGAEIRQFALEHATPFRVSAVAVLAGSLLLTVFIAGLAQLLRRSRPDSVMPAVLVVSGSVAIVGMLLNAATASVFAFSHELDGVPDSTVVTYYEVAEVAEHFMSGWVLGGPCMLLVATFSLGALRDRLMARWVCWFGFFLAAEAAFEMVSALFPDPGVGGLHLIVIFGWWLWPLMVGCALGWRWLRLRRR
jgi:hypothetical protein